MKVLYFFTALYALTIFSCSSNPSAPTVAVLTLSKTSMSFSNEKNQDSIVISNDGEEQLSWNITSKPDWLRTSRQSGTLATARDTLTFTADTDRSLGEHTGIVQFSSNGGDKDISVILRINPSINPGTSAAGITLGDAYSTVLNKFGNPSQVGFFTDNSNNIVATWANFASKGLWFIMGDSQGITPVSTDNVTQIWIESPFSGVTDRNIGIDSAKSEVTDVYGAPEETGNDQDRYPSLGITFGYDSSDLVERIFIAPPR